MNNDSSVNEKLMIKLMVEILDNYEQMEKQEKHTQQDEMIS
jgi:hypothetical protein